MRAFAQIPTHVRAALLRCEHVHFFERVLSDVTDPEISISSVDCKPEGITQTVEPNFAARTLANERIGGRNGIVEAGRVRRIDIDAQDLAEQYVDVLTVALRVAAAAAIAETDVEKAVFAECEAAAFVIGKRLIDRKKNIFRVGVGEVCVARRRSKFGNYGLKLAAGVAGVVYKKAAVLRVHGMERQTEEAGFAAAGEAGSAADIEKRGRGARSVALDDLDVATLFDHEEASCSVARLLQIERAGKTVRYGHQVERCGRRRRRRIWR